MLRMTTNAEDDSGTVEAAGSAPAADTGEGAPADDETSLRARIAELEDERVELMNRVTRARADQSNLKRRSAQEVEDGTKFANQLFAADLLRVIDSLDRALGAVPQNLHGFSWIDGILIFRAQVDSLLRSQGVERIEALGEEFDPRFHEAVAQEGDAGAEGVVREVYQPGYMIHDRLLRPALVQVGPVDEGEEDEGEVAEAVSDPGGDESATAGPDAGAE